MEKQRLGNKMELWIRLKYILFQKTNKKNEYFSGFMNKPLLKSFSNYNVYKIHLEYCHNADFDAIDLGRAWDFAFLTDSQLTPMLLFYKLVSTRSYLMTSKFPSPFPSRWRALFRGTLMNYLILFHFLLYRERQPGFNHNYSLDEEEQISHLWFADGKHCGR